MRLETLDGIGVKKIENNLHCIDFYRALATAIVGVLEGVGRERALEMW